ncbi:hypothetical protein [Pseudodonghicola flavimaris]|uniref:Arylsulfatase n=1 Tax=Pseudodonghicola flavimaris TaxID=3050036 RepID=A0ABT7EXE9_9RHOB|nr:hypothetical protein [Pseudodonghicola flavimaris]MDK3017019.1 hypothetical protein [Pseudodonghicola flavimaris]
MADLTLIHTAEVHRATFDRIAARIAPGARLAHIVHPDWLARARTGIGTDLAAEVTATLRAISGPVLCSCTTLGPLAADAGAIRIDAPMMARAARLGGPILMAYCLDSTRAPSLALLRQACAAAGHVPEIRPLDLTTAWPLFEAGPPQTFSRQIADRIGDQLAAAPEIACVVLAQASMAGATGYLKTAVPVLSSPETALQAALGLTPPG